MSVIRSSADLGMIDLDVHQTVNETVDLLEQIDLCWVDVAHRHNASWKRRSA
jgi:hypothetical protein